MSDELRKAAHKLLQRIYSDSAAATGPLAVEAQALSDALTDAAWTSTHAALADEPVAERAESVLADLVDQIRKTAPIDDHGHKLTMNMAYLRAVALLSRPAAPKAEPAQCDDCDECERLRDQMSKLLTGVANALRGDPGPLHRWSWHDLPERAEAAVVAIGVMQKAAIASSAAPAPAVPPGWKLVPVEPTPMMCEVGGIECGTGMFGDPMEADKVYRAMLAAAPQPTEPKP